MGPQIALGVRSIPVPDRTKYLAHTHPISLVGTSKSQSSFQALRIKCAIQTLRIRQHRNVHAGHMVLTSSHFLTQLIARSHLAEKMVDCDLSLATDRNISFMIPKPCISPTALGKIVLGNKGTSELSQIFVSKTPERARCC